MYGMLMGTAVFSTMVSYWAQQETKKLEQEQIKQQKEAAKDVRNALKNSILTENIATANSAYSTDVDLNRAKAFTSRSTGKTRSGADYTIRERDTATTFGQMQKRILVTTSDDTFLKDDVTAQANAGELSTYSAQDSEAVELFDTQEVRQTQINQSKEYLQMEASQLYRYWAQNSFTFPANHAAYLASVNSLTGLKDVWGNDFTYVFTNANQATLSFTTPWAYTYTMNLDMN